jgi:hypothetical protein
VCPDITLLIVQTNPLSSRCPSNQALVVTLGIIECANRPVSATSHSACQCFSMSRLASILKSQPCGGISRQIPESAAFKFLYSKMSQPSDYKLPNKHLNKKGTKGNPGEANRFDVCLKKANIIH